MTPTVEQTQNRDLIRNFEPQISPSSSGLRLHHHRHVQSFRHKLRERRDRPQFFSSSFVKQIANMDLNPSCISSPKSLSKNAHTGQIFFDKRISKKKMGALISKRVQGTASQASHPFSLPDSMAARHRTRNNNTQIKSMTLNVTTSKTTNVDSEQVQSRFEKRPGAGDRNGKQIIKSTQMLQ